MKYPSGTDNDQTDGLEGESRFNVLNMTQSGLPTPNGGFGAVTPRPIESYPAGYPRFSALISSHASFQVFRRFSTLRNRLLLEKQDALSRLEEKLEKLDADEQRVLFLGSLRRDSNAERRQAMEEIDRALADYDSFLLRNKEAMKYHTAKERNRSNLKNWLKASGCIARSEVVYLERDDLIAVGDSDADAIHSSFESFLEDIMILLRVPESFHKRVIKPVSSNADVYVFQDGFINIITRFVVALVPIVGLLAPMVIILSLNEFKARLAVIISALSVLMLLLSTFVRLHTGELFLAGATYAAVLVVFITESGPAS